MEHRFFFIQNSNIVLNDKKKVSTHKSIIMKILTKTKKHHSSHLQTQVFNKLEFRQAVIQGSIPTSNIDKRIFTKT